MNANIKESHNFENDGDSLKSFIFISVIIRRFYLARSPMLWQNTADLLIIAVSSFMPRSEELD